MNVIISEEVKARTSGIKLGVGLINNMEVRRESNELELMKKNIIREIKNKLKVEELKNNEIINKERKMYRLYKMDPTKLRTSSEALVRKVLTDGTLPKINTIVDCNNICSITSLLPMGVYDYDHIKGDIIVRTAEKDEKIHLIGGKQYSFEGGEIVVSDYEKILCLGYATADCDSTKITKNTKNIVLLVYSFPAISMDYTSFHLNKTVDLMIKIGGGNKIETFLV